MPLSLETRIINKEEHSRTRSARKRKVFATTMSTKNTPEPCRQKAVWGGVAPLRKAQHARLNSYSRFIYVSAFGTGNTTHKLPKPDLFAVCETEDEQVRYAFH